MDESECRDLRGFRKENAGCGADRQKCGTDAGSDAKQWKTATISIGAGSCTKISTSPNIPILSTIQ
jgi:hypothetical protein